MKTMENGRSYLYNACLNDYGYFEGTVGTDVARKLHELETPTDVIRAYVRYGWVEKVGSGLVLTKTGYDKC